MSIYGFKSTVPKEENGYRAILAKSKHKELKPYQDKIGKHSGMDFGLYTIGEGKKRKNKEYAIRNRKTRESN